LSKTVLITGGTGFLGAYTIAKLVENGYSVRAIRRNTSLPFFISTSIFDKVEWVPGDILDVESLNDAMQGMDAVIHVAGKVSFHGRDTAALYRINTEGTANVVNMALENNIQRFVHVSSVAALGRTANGEVVNEEKKWETSKLNTTYAISKHYAEMEVWRGMGEGLNTVIVNPATILGYGDWNSSSCAIFKNVYKEFPWYTTGINGFVDVEDVARAKKRPHREATPFIGSLAWRMEKMKSMVSGKKPLLTRQSARVAQSKTHFDNRKILKALPTFAFTPLAQAVDNACAKYLSRERSVK
jgi:nucleoside-diphosphate-sugar epimerase